MNNSNKVLNTQEIEKKVVIFTAPSGAGKTTLVRYLLEQIDSLAFSVSATTREKRFYEVDKEDYYFLSEQVFKDKIEVGDFLEWEEVYKGCLYGTLKSEVERIWSLGKHVIFDVDVKGAKNIKNYYQDKALAIFVKPPSVQTLVSRLQARKTETLESLNTRIERAKTELTYENDFDTIVLNDDLDEAKKAAIALVSRFLNIKVPV